MKALLETILGHEPLPFDLGFGWGIIMTLLIENAVFQLWMAIKMTRDNANRSIVMSAREALAWLLVPCLGVVLAAGIIARNVIPEQPQNGQDISQFALEPVGGNGCVAKTLGATRYELWDCVNHESAGMGWRVVIKIEAIDTLHHVADPVRTIRDKRGWVTGYKNRTGTTWKIPEGWQLIGLDVWETNRLLSPPGSEPGSYNTGLGGDMVEIVWTQENNNVFTIRQKSLNGWWGGSFPSGSYMDADRPLQKIELHLKVCRKITK